MGMQKMRKIPVIIWPIAGIVILDGIALFQGHDGILLTGAVAVIAGLARYKLKN